MNSLNSVVKLVLTLAFIANEAQADIFTNPFHLREAFLAEHRIVKKLNAIKFAEDDCELADLIKG